VLSEGLSAIKFCFFVITVLLQLEIKTEKKKGALMKIAECIMLERVKKEGLFPSNQLAKIHFAVKLFFLQFCLPFFH